MKTREIRTFSLPPRMAEETHRVMEEESRTFSELMREALRRYFEMRRFPVETPTPADLKALRRGRAAVARGKYVRFDDLSRPVGTAHRQARSKTT